MHTAIAVMAENGVAETSIDRRIGKGGQRPAAMNLGWKSWHLFIACMRPLSTWNFVEPMQVACGLR